MGQPFDYARTVATRFQHHSFLEDMFWKICFVRVAGRHTQNIFLKPLILPALRAGKIKGFRVLQENEELIFLPKTTYTTKPGIFDEKRGTAALLIKNSRFCFIFNP